MEVISTMRTKTAILSILATGLLSYSAIAQEEAAPPSEGAAPAPEAAPAAAPEAAPAPAPEMAPPAAAAPAAASDTKFEAGIAFLPMLLGKMKVSGAGGSATSDLAFAYGVAPVFGYAVIPGLTVGIAPQFIFNVKPKGESSSATEYDFMARIAYAYPVIPKLTAGLEILPGYSMISLPSEAKNVGQGVTLSNPKGFVMAFGATAAMDITDMIFVNLGIGYQMGFQSASASAGGRSASGDVKTSFLRIAVGGGVRF
jgi:hypothetical protein